MMEDKIERAVERTNKNLDNALEVAVDALKRIAKPQAWSPIYAESLIAKDALAKIAAILKVKQKD